MVSRLLLGLGVTVLSACGAAPLPSVSPSATVMEPPPTPPPAVVLPEPVCPSSTYSPPPRLTCEMAVIAALANVAFTSSPESITFNYGAYCPEGGRCPPAFPGLGFVVIEMGGGAGDVFVEITLEDSGPDVVAEARPAQPYPPES